MTETTDISEDHVALLEWPSLRLVFLEGSRLSGNIKPVLMLEHIFEKQDTAVAVGVVSEFNRIISKMLCDEKDSDWPLSNKKPNDSSIFREWYDNEDEVDEKFTRGYMNILYSEVLPVDGFIIIDIDLLQKMDILKQALNDVILQVKALRKMEDIRQLAVEYGCLFADVLKDNDLSVSHAWCMANKGFMSDEDMKRFNDAGVNRRGNDDISL